jgi:hypothetical protein
MLILIAIFIIIYIFIKIYIIRKKGLSVRFYITRGIRCYSCKSEILDINDLKILSVLQKNFTDNPKYECFTLCKTCNREHKLIDITSNRLITQSRILSFNRYLYSYKYNIIRKTIIILLVVSNIIDFLITIYLNYVTFFGLSFNTIYWIIIYYNTKISYIEKPSK